MNLKQSNQTHLVTSQQQAVRLFSPVHLPLASSFLWNQSCLVQVNNRGYVNSQFLQPEPAKLSRGPALEATTFMQPEQPYYTDHPGRFVYVKDEATSQTCSLPYAPMMKPLDQFQFICEKDQVSWQVCQWGLEFNWQLNLSETDQAEIWTLTVKNTNDNAKKLSVYPTFSMGYMSWMNQSASFSKETNCFIAKAITPYQKVEQYFDNQELKDWRLVYADKQPDAWTTQLSDFIGQGSMQQPDSLKQAKLCGKNSYYETPLAAFQYQLDLAARESQTFKFMFAPVKDQNQIDDLLAKFKSGELAHEIERYRNKLVGLKSCVDFGSDQQELDQFVNHWLPRQVSYHGDVNRLTTDPQTRNYLQDAMGLIYLEPHKCREHILIALSQQHSSGEMPDGILLHPDAELKYINQVPHTDHCVWVPIVLKAYLDETGDSTILAEQVAFGDSEEKTSVAVHVSRAIDWLLQETNEKGLSYINQGDWCDPMNMVGHKGQGVSSWLSFATSYGIKLWLDICHDYQGLVDVDTANLENKRQFLNQASLQHFWAEPWFGRGITDDGRLFGQPADNEGKIFLNPQSWAIMAQALPKEKLHGVLKGVVEHLYTSHGVTMLAPAFTSMHEDIGRVTQKYPGSAENGSVYNHAAVFWAMALYQLDEADLAFDVIERMVPNVDSLLQRGQLPLYIPNYYRGARNFQPEYVGKSSQLFNTGTCSWVLRLLIEEFAGLKGCRDGLKVLPKLPSKLSTLKVTRMFRGATFITNIVRSERVEKMEVRLDGELLANNMVTSPEQGKQYQLNVLLPAAQQKQLTLAIVSGVSGSGKSVVAEALAKQQHSIYVDADDFHSPEAKAQMASGVPLTNAQREPWIRRLTEHLSMLHDNGLSVVLAYSGLKHSHRQVFYQLPFATKMFQLQVSETELTRRLSHREGHFFHPNLLQSQLDGMEPAADNESRLALIDGEQDLLSIVQQINTEF